MKCFEWFLLLCAFAKWQQIAGQQQLPPGASHRLLASEFNNQQDKALFDRIKKVAYALLYARLTLEAEFPTATTSANISTQCKADSQLYYQSYITLQNWALRST